MAAIHVILDERERPVPLRFDQGPMNLHHASISFDGLVFEDPNEIWLLSQKLSHALLKAINGSKQKEEAAPDTTEAVCETGPRS